MSKILVVSDTHGNNQLFRDVLQREVSHVNYCFHLGDNYEDIARNKIFLGNIITFQVPGIFHSGYFDGTIPKVQTVNIDGWSFFLVHCFEDIPVAYMDVDLFCFGHTHKQLFGYNDSIGYVLNPGHLKQKTDRGYKASYAILTTSKTELIVQLKDYTGITIDESIVTKD